MYKSLFTPRTRHIFLLPICMDNNEMQQWLNKAIVAINESGSVDIKMWQLQKHVHVIIASGLFEIFPYLPDTMDAAEIRYMGERINRHLQMLSAELKDLAYKVEQRTSNNNI